VAAATGIDLNACPSLFDIDVENVRQKLQSLPAITEAKVERHLPGTLAVRIIPRVPKAWISCPDAGFSDVRRTGAMLVDHLGIPYPCPETQSASAASLPIIVLPASAGHPIIVGKKIRHPELAHCFLLLDSARAADPEAVQWIESIRQVNEWSLELLTRQGTSAIFSLGDHARQMESLRAALDHSGEKGYVISTINLIPKYNIPITLSHEASPPKAIPVSATADAAGDDETRRARDLSNLLNRN
jgi:hypothetical protein